MLMGIPFLDLSSEIRGEQSRFIDAMQQATTIHVNREYYKGIEYRGLTVIRASSEL
jgi:hypothetical protein